jgi:hypothetical protein
MSLPSFPDDCLPPECDYESREALFAAINAWAASRGYAFITRKSTKTPSGRCKVTYACDRSWKHPNAPKERQRNTATRGTGCQFSVLAIETLDKSIWSVRYRDKRFCMHNHAPSQHPSAHPVHRQLSKEDMATVSSLSDAGIAPKEIRTFLRQNSDSLATQQDVYNQLAAIRREDREGQSSIVALVNQLDNEGFWNRIQLGPDGRVTAVLFAHPDSLGYLQVCRALHNVVHKRAAHPSGRRTQASGALRCFLAGNNENKYLKIVSVVTLTIFKYLFPPFPAKKHLSAPLACEPRNNKSNNTNLSLGLSRYLTAGLYL